MANPSVGLMYPVFAPFVSHTEGSLPSYGTGVVIQEARNVNITKTYNNNPLYGDDHEVDDDNHLSALGMSFEPTGLTDSDRKVLFDEKDIAFGGITAQAEGDNETPYGGFGYIRKMRENGVRKYEAWIVLKIKFQEESQNTATEEGSITWGTPTLTGRAARLVIDSSDEAKFRVHSTFDTASAAKSWINSVLNISAVTT